MVPMICPRVHTRLLQVLFMLIVILMLKPVLFVLIVILMLKPFCTFYCSMLCYNKILKHFNCWNVPFQPSRIVLCIHESGKPTFCCMDTTYRASFPFADIFNELKLKKRSNSHQLGIVQSNNKNSSYCRKRS